MRVVFGIVSLLVVLVLVGLLTRKSLDATQLAVPATQGEAAAPAGTVREQSQQIQQQYKADLENALNQRRPESAD